MHIGQAIRLLRIQRGLTQEQLALEAQVATSNVSRIENGQRQPTQNLLKRLALALGTSASQLYVMTEQAGPINSSAEEIISPDFCRRPEPQDIHWHEEEAAQPVPALTPETLALLRYFQRLSPEHKTLALEHMRLLNRMQGDEGE
ncbi:MAG: XRE family transcriptional regulator [Alcanivorax sp.]|nr:XRE family transcriptional regulator [Alcanivorax sp.]